MGSEPGKRGVQDSKAAPRNRAACLSALLTRRIPRMQPATDQVLGRVASLHLHPELSGGGMRSCASFELVEAMGIAGESRYFGRKKRSTGEPTVRQVSLIEREVLAAHAAALGISQLEPGQVRSNIETEGVELMSLIGKQIQIGQALLRVCEPRTPCAKMDAVQPGLRGRMENGKQGVLAQVLRSGEVRQGDLIRPGPEFS